MGTCCSKKSDQAINSQGNSAQSYNPPKSEAEKEALRKLQADAALARSKDFKQGGGGEKLKAKSKALEDAKAKNFQAGPDLDWN